MTDTFDVVGWIVAALVRFPLPLQAPTDEIVATADQEGVAALLFERLHGADAGAPPALVAALAEVARRKAVQGLAQEQRCREILELMKQLRVPVLVLKGSALAYWAYRQPYLRECSDIDLLVATRADAERVVESLAPMGYRCINRVLPGDLVGFEYTCRHAGNGQEIDVHWHLSSTPLFAWRFSWTDLWNGAQALSDLAPNARGLAPVPAYLHACMHRAQNLALGVGDRLKWLYDLSVLGQRFSAGEWLDVRRQAIQRGLAGACVTAADAAAARFGPIMPDDVHAALCEAAGHEWLRIDRMPSWLYFQYATWRSFPRNGMRWRWLRQRLIPDAAYLHERHGERGGWIGQLLRRALAGIERLQR